MNTHRSNAPAGVAIAISLLLLATGVFEAVSPVVDPASGSRFTVDIVYDPANPSVQGVRLVEETTAGQLLTDTIPSSYDTVMDLGPAVALSPDGQAVVVWSRHDGSDFELAITRRHASGWVLHGTLTSNTTSDVEPRLLVDYTQTAHVLWWGSGLGGPVYLQSFDPSSGAVRSLRQQPFEPAGKRLTPYFDPDAGGIDDPGIPTKNANNKASAYPCPSNPAAAPEHGVVMACGRAAAWQLSACQLVVGVQDPFTSAWSQTVVDLSSANLTGISPQQIAQQTADWVCD
ncbi:MAG TPA: hypothetical protein VJV23_05305 [Candidatus Polarisedimenticolia bacterium]|nr:hypothetical protein [Candidatus Polarisedimenticolia bacterium]